VVAAARAAGRVLAVGFNRRFRAPYRRLRRLVGEAGGVRLVAAELVTHAGRWDVAPGLDAMLADVGCHLLDLVPWLAGQPLRAVAVRSRPAGGGEEVADFSIELGDGSTVACRAGYGRRAREGVVTAAATGGRRRLVHAFGALPVDPPPPLRYPLALAQEVASTALRRATRRPGLTVESVGLQLDAFTGSIGGAATTGLASARDGLRAAAAVDALLASAAAAGARVELAAVDEE
jgi:predicted dehydrogenase